MKFEVFYIWPDVDSKKGEMKSFIIEEDTIEKVQTSTGRRMNELGLEEHKNGMYAKELDGDHRVRE